MASEVIVWAQNISTNLCFSPGLVTGFGFTLRLDAWRCVHGRFEVPREPCKRATHTSESEFCLVFSLIVFQATTAENVWRPPPEKSARSQVSAALFYVHTVRSYGHGSVQMIRCLAMLSQSKHWPGGRRVCRTCSASPVK